MKIVLILKGNVGSGKSTLAHSIQKQGYKHLDIDYYYNKVGRPKKTATWHRDLKSIKKAYMLMFADIISLSKKHNLVLESAGVNENWLWILPKLKKLKNIRVVQVYVRTPIWLCKKRVRRRNMSKKTHEKYTALAFVDFISKLWHKRVPEYDYVIDGSQSSKKTLVDLKTILKKTNVST